MTSITAIRRAALLLFAAAATSAHADLVFADGKARLSGFGSITGTHLDSKILTYRSTGQTERGADNSGVAFSPDTKAGAQLDFNWSPQFSATAQLLTRSNGNGNWNPSLQWGFLRANLSPNAAVRAGRIGTQFFLISDFREVNYANVWVRPPVDVYGQVTNGNFDGADLSYKGELLGRTVGATVYAGRSTEPYVGDKLVLKRLAGFNLTIEPTDSLTLRLGYGRTNLQATAAALDQLAQGYRAVAANPAAPALGLNPAAINAFAEQIATQDAYSTFSGIGFAWDSGEWLASGEYTRRASESYIPRSQGAYLSVGRRIASWTPYAYWGRSIISNQRVNPLPLTAPGAIGQLAAAGSSVLRTGDRAQRTLGIGSRYDFGKNVALKAQLDVVTLHSPSGLFDLAPTAPSQKDRTVRILSLAMDFAF